MTRSIPLALVVLMPLAARAETPVRYVKIEEHGGKLAAPVTVTKFQVVPETITVNVNGVPQTRTVNRSVPVQSTEMQPLTPEAGDYFTPTGERIDPKKLANILKKGAVLALASEGKPLDPEVVKKNKEIVAILVPKGSAKVAPKVAADEKPFATEASFKDGKILIVREVTVHQAVTKQVARAVGGGKVETVTVTENVPVAQKRP